MSPPVKCYGKPVKKLNRRESSCVPFWLSPLLAFNGVASNPIQNREILCVRQRDKTFVAATLSVATWPGRQWVVLFVDSSIKRGNPKPICNYPPENMLCPFSLTTRKHTVLQCPYSFFHFFFHFFPKFWIAMCVCVCVYNACDLAVP